MTQSKINHHIRTMGRTLLGVGPMSTNCIDSAIELADQNEIPILLIASRRQIDSKEFGGGYVNNWTTQQFADYVRAKSQTGNAILARDHGGPWQNNLEKERNLSLPEAMASAKLSYTRDIEAGMQVLHIDPSLDINGQPSTREVLDRIFELYGFCWETARSMNREVLFEVGTEEQTGGTNDVNDLDFVISSINAFCESIGAPKPSFTVVQCGTRVMEARNVGSLGGYDPDKGQEVNDELRNMIDVCNRHGVFLKEHNTDYLTDDALRMHPIVGIHSANVAPEFGVTETRAFIQLLEQRSLHPLIERFLRLSYDSRKWEKWMLHDTCASDRDRSIIAGHYVFSTPEFLQIKEESSHHIKDIDIQLKAAVKSSISRYLHHFGGII